MKHIFKPEHAAVRPSNNGHSAAATGTESGPAAEDLRRFLDDLDAVIASVTGVVVASERTIRLALLGLFGQGHVLLEDLPGVGKTLIARTIAQSIECEFKRIQFTPDLLPSGITGSSIFDMQGTRFEFVPGPIFANIVLADEINRTGPRTQSALLEAMAEFQVTVDGDVRPLPTPFLVIATQNLSESHGTFPLPDSQKDRFLVSMGLGLPDSRQEEQILARSQHGMPAAVPALTADRVVEMQEVVRSVEVSTPIRQYMVNLVSRTRAAPGVESGVSPRGGAALQRAAQCWAAFNGRGFVIPEDVQAVAKNVLSHRLTTRPDADAAAGRIVEGLVESVPVPA